MGISGGTLAYTTAGVGAPVLLIHGLGGSQGTWDQVVDALATGYRVIAPDLPGHGQSDAAAGDYSLGAYASALRDLLVALGHRSATIVGHSLGGGIAMQFAYQFPDRADRLVLISSGGLGPQLTPMLRAATLPGAETVVANLACLPEGLTRRLLSAASILPGLVARPDAGALARGLHQLGRSGPRRTFIRTARTVINWRGQTVSATQHLRQLVGLPVLLAWGSDDRTIPPHHHRAVASLLARPQLIEISGAGHFPHETAPAQLVPAVLEFLASTTAFRYSEARWRRLLQLDLDAATTSRDRR
ncbi:alpha/beta fold hydrolase [Dactylosporangium darangshiense]|uniref:Alpha/beta fold hydrolase n=1 Tax=Dactylosporangium darangshiense TaxID=579108 RepID=A0ABP8DVX6_9ACTN